MQNIILAMFLLVNGVLDMGIIHHVRNITIKVFLCLFLSLSYYECLRLGYILGAWEWNYIVGAWEWNCILEA